MLTRGWALWKCHCEEDKKKVVKTQKMTALINM